MSLPYFPMYPSDFEAKTSHLSIAEDGAYNRLLRICWMTPGCTMPADEDWVMRRARAVDDGEQSAMRAVLAEFFTIKNGRYSNGKLLRIWHEANDAHEKRKNAGSMGGKAKSLKTQKPVSSNAVAKPKQPEPEPELDKEKEETNVSSKKRGIRLPDDWKPNLEFTQGEGVDDTQALREAEKMRDYFNAQPGQKGVKLDWDATYRNWIRKFVDDGKKKGGESGKIPWQEQSEYRGVII